MSEQRQLVQHIESFVDSSCSPGQQTASLDAIVFLLKNDVLTIEALVREMEMYLTTTDYLIRAKGILLLAEVLARLESKPLDSTTLHSLIVFFAERLEDWKALRGALVGCLALMRRNSNVGMVVSSDAKMVVHSFLQSQQVQALGQHDRKLCFELLECLLDRYPDAVAVVGDILVFGICEAIDGEKDPQCLMLTFHIIELLALLFPDPSGPLADIAGELFEILGGYFPIHFTHPGGEEIDVKRDDLSKALMRAFSCTPLFEPFAIPLLLEKLSSSLLVAKVDSLKYLSSCTLKYGIGRMEKHANAIWSSIKEAVCTSMQDTGLSFYLESDGDRDFQDNEITAEALILLQKVIMQNTSLFLNLITTDEDIDTFINSVTSFRSSYLIPLQSKQKLYAIGCILSVSAKASISSCSGLFEHFFLRLMDVLGFSVKSSSEDCTSEDNCILPEKLNVGVLYLCVELLSACRDLFLDSECLTLKSYSEHEALSLMLHRFSNSLAEIFSSIFVRSANDVVHDLECYVGARGLQTLATFPGGILPLSKATYDNILLKLMSIITMDSNKTLQWKLVLKALVRIGAFVEKYNESDKALSYMSIVVDKIISTLDDFSLPISFKLEALYDVGTTGMKFMLRAVQGLEEAISASLSEVYVHGNSMRKQIVIQLLECYSSKFLPWFQKIGGFEEIPFRFANNIWSQIENGMVSNASIHEKELLNATMTAMKLAVASCSEENQSSIVEKAYGVLSSSPFCFKESTDVTALIWLRKLQCAKSVDGFSCQDECLVSLLASALMAVRPKTNIKNLRGILNLFTSLSLMGQVPAAQALGSVLNKLPSEINGAEIQGDLSLEEALDIIFDRSLWNFVDEKENDIGHPTLPCSILEGRSLQIHAIFGLAWMGKGLLMRGHEKVKDITMILLRCLLSNGDENAFPLRQVSLDNNIEQDLTSSVRKSAGDAFHIFMHDSEACLNRKFHTIIRPLYKQRFFSTLMPVLLSSIAKSDSSTSRVALYRACGFVISDTPLAAIFSEANKIVPIIVDGLSMLSEDIVNKDLIYNLLLVLSAILTDKNGQDVVVENAHTIINCLTQLVFYPHMMLVRETSIQCLVAMADLPHTRTYPMRAQVLRSISKAFDDPKRAVRQEAVRCQQAWTSIASRSFHS